MSQSFPVCSGLEFPATGSVASSPGLQWVSSSPPLPSAASFHKVAPYVSSSVLQKLLTVFIHTLSSCVQAALVWSTWPGLPPCNSFSQTIYPLLSTVSWSLCLGTYSLVHTTVAMSLPLEFLMFTLIAYIDLEGCGQGLPYQSLL